MRVADIMSRDVVTVGPDHDVVAVRKLFDKHGFHHLLVVLHGQLVGVISDRDVLREASPFIDTLAERPQDLATLKKRVHQIMSRDLVVAHGDDSVADAAAVMLARRVSCLPVVTAERHVEGVVTSRDLLRALTKVRAP
ncbi:MAG: CBS domain-containing protein [Polyangiaceae bacterium]